MLLERAALDHVFHALADPSRRAIVARLTTGPATVSALAEPLPMSLAAVGQHIRILDDSGLIRTEKVGRVRTCRLTPDSFRPAEQWMAAHRLEWERHLDRLQALMSEDRW